MLAKMRFSQYLALHNIQCCNFARVKDSERLQGRLKMKQNNRRKKLRRRSNCHGDRTLYSICR